MSYAQIFGTIACAGLCSKTYCTEEITRIGIKRLQIYMQLSELTISRVDGNGILEHKTVVLLLLAMQYLLKMPRQIVDITLMHLCEFSDARATYKNISFSIPKLKNQT